MRRALLVLTLLAAACASGDASTHAGGATRQPSQPAVFASCGSVRFPALPPDSSSFIPFASWSEVNLASVGGEAQFFEEFVDRYSWFVADQSSSTRLLFGEPNEPTDADSPNGDPLLGDSLYAYAHLELRDGRWAPSGWGGCRIEVEADGWGNARFILDPTVRPDPQSSMLSVLATEMFCAGGQAPRGREVGAVVVDETEEAISIVILVEPPTGGQTCPWNPSFEFQVDLGSPLGDRAILDASVYPPLEREWSPGHERIRPLRSALSHHLARMAQNDVDAVYRGCAGFGIARLGRSRLRGTWVVRGVASYPPMAWCTSALRSGNAGAFEQPALPRSRISHEGTRAGLRTFATSMLRQIAIGLGRPG